jgi:hypothetical protein
MSNETDNNDRNWEINVNLSGLQAPTGAANVEQGYYKGKVTDMYVRPEKPGRVVIKLTISEGRFAGAVRTTGLNIPKDSDDKVRYYWRGFAESVGYTPKELDAGEVSLGMNSFKGREAHFFYTPKELTSDGYDSVDFLPPVEWTQRSASFVPSEPMQDGASGSALGAAGGLGSSSGGTTSADEVRNKLGLG